MSVKEKFEDAKALAKNDRKIWFISGFVGLVLVVWFFTVDNTGNHRNKGKDQPAPVQTSTFNKEDAYVDLIKAFQNDMGDVQRGMTSMQQSLERVKTDTDSTNERYAGIFKRMLTQVEELTDEVETLKKAPQQEDRGSAGNANDGQPKQEPGNEVVALGFEKELMPPPPPTAPVGSKVTFISPGDAVPIQLLTGVNAPTDGTPYPVVFKLKGPIRGPDGSSLDLGEARIVAMALGSEVDSRVLFRLTNMAIRHTDGRRSVVNVDGWVVGEDGVRGMKGHLIDKLGKLILATGITAAGTAFANDAFGNNQDINVQGSGVNVDSDTAEAAVGTGLNQASKRLMDVLINRYEQIVPVVEVLSGRDGVAIFSIPIEVSPYDESSEAMYALGDLN